MINLTFWLINILQKELFYINGSNPIWAKAMKSLLQNFYILISVTWPFQNVGLKTSSLIFLNWIFRLINGSLFVSLSLSIYIYRQIDLTKAKVLNIQVFYNNNLFENWKLYTIKHSQRFDPCSASYSCGNRIFYHFCCHMNTMNYKYWKVVNFWLYIALNFQINYY